MKYLIEFRTSDDVLNYLRLISPGKDIEPAFAIEMLGLNLVTLESDLNQTLKKMAIIFAERAFCNLSRHYIFFLQTIPVNLQHISSVLLGMSNPDPLKIMGILNITPDSFSDGNNYLHLMDSLNQARKMLSEGADIIDIGGESTRPGAELVDLDTELKRVIPVIQALKRDADSILSVDTYKAQVAEEAIQVGVNIINDISALRFDPEMVNVIKRHPDVKLVLMHMSGTPRTMQDNPEYDNVIEELLEFFEERIAYCIKEGISPERIIIDPGIGFGKRQQDNLNILRYLSAFHSLGCEVLLGTSRKSFINRIDISSPEQRLPGTLATTGIALYHKIQYIRIHDVKENIQYIKVSTAISRG
jgi:dihydropteroate synthase